MPLVADPARSVRIGLIGNPNTGKSTLFNRLTGLRQRTANYPGITVERKSGLFRYGDENLEIVDLPGAYSLAASSPDEKVVVDCLSSDDPDSRVDLVVCVVDASALEKNLFLAFQLADFGVPMILVLNQWDRVCRRGLRIDTEVLSSRLGIPVIPVSSVSGFGIDELGRVISKSLRNPRRLEPTPWPEPAQRCSRPSRGRISRRAGRSTCACSCRSR